MIKVILILYTDEKKRIYFSILTVSFASCALYRCLYFYSRCFFPPYARLAHERAVARQLALGGIEWARTILARPRKEEKKKGKEGAEKQTLSPDMQDLLMLFPAINRWQNFELKKESDGIDATIRICISSEEGKINLNSVWDFKQKKFKDSPPQGSTEKIIQELSVKLETFQVKGFREGVSQFLKKQKGPLSDITQLLEDEYFKKNFQETLFYAPPMGQ